MDWKKVSLNDSYSFWHKTTWWSQRSPAFYQDIEKLFPVEYWVHPSYGCLPLINNKGVYTALSDIICYNSCSLPCNNIAEAILSFPHTIAIEGMDWMLKDHFKDVKTYEVQAAVFQLPESWEMYLNTLSKSSRKSLRVAEDLNKDLTVVEGECSDQEFETALEWFTDKWKDVDLDEPDPTFRFWYENSSKGIQVLYFSGYLFPIAVYDQGTLVGLNLAEYDSVNNRLLDLWSARNPEYDRARQLGKFLTNKSIQHSIKTKVKTYDLGVSDEWFEYKNTWIPKDAPPVNLINFLSIKGDASPLGDIDPPYYINNILYDSPQ